MTDDIVELLRSDAKHGSRFNPAIEEIKDEFEQQTLCFNIETLLSNIDEKQRLIGKGSLNGEWRSLLMIKIQTEVGKVYSVNGNAVSVTMSDAVKSNTKIIDGVVYRIGQVSSFLKFPLGHTSLYGIVNPNRCGCNP
jgi:hypothetical protein